MSDTTNDSPRRPFIYEASSESRWLTTTHLSDLFQEFFTQEDIGLSLLSERKLRLFACVCARHFTPLLFDKRSEDAIEIAEWFCDSKAEVNDLLQAESSAREVVGKYRGVAAHAAEAVANALNSSSLSAASAVSEEIREGTSRDEEIANRCDLLRDIFGNPFSPIESDPRWRTSNVVDLAQVIYDERAFEKMPILSDALMDASCDSEEIIAHCRGDGPHVRGCWVVDLLTGRE